MQRHSSRSGDCAYDVLVAFQQAQRCLYPPKVEELLNTDRATNHEDDADLREEQAVAAATNILRQHIDDLTLTRIEFNAGRGAFLLALDTYRKAGGAR